MSGVGDAVSSIAFLVSAVNNQIADHQLSIHSYNSDLATAQQQSD
jgi:hypothetical protein